MTETTIVWLIGAYLLGAIPFGLIFSRWLSQRDPRQHGSGNIGATNAMRTGGKRVGILTLLADIIKGATPVALAMFVGDGSPLLLASVALAAFIGHIYPVYLKFQGGKGVATMFGVLIPWMPWAAVIAFAFWLLVFFSSRYVALASIAAALTVPALAVWMRPDAEVEWLATAVISALVVLRHRSNIQRLLRHEEPKTGGKQGETYVEKN